ncbi:MAG: type II toxin-antitoxin system RelE/ParE family toxin [Candidatus Diapherotrites archaeon]|nr:type II toxin-antitoxin system RelE/ParE family toxin [Candidatus Diapherotrites archaeon]
MPFKVKWHKKARKELRGLPKKVARQLVLKASKLTDDPIHDSFPLGGCSLRKIRGGEYRAIIEVVFKKKVVKVLLVDHRKNIYKKLFR